MVIDVIAERADGGAGRPRGRQERDRLRGRALRTIGVGDAMPAARRASVLAQELPSRGIQQPDRDVTPLHVHIATDPAGRRAVVGRVDFDTAVEVHRARAKAVVAKRLDRQRAEGGPLIGKHRSDLALRRPMNARVGPARFPVIEIGLRRLERLEAESLERRLLRVPDARLDFPFAIGIAHAARQRDRVRRTAEAAFAPTGAQHRWSASTSPNCGSSQPRHRGR